MKRATLAAVMAVAAVAAAPAACSSSTSPDLATVLDGGGSSLDSGTTLPTSETCTGDATACIAGTVTTRSFGAVYSAAKVEIFKVFPTGAISSIASMPLAKSGKYAFSNLAPWSHYYVKATILLGTGSSAKSVGALRGRFAVPFAAGTTADVVVVPVQLEALETSVGGARTLRYASAHVYDPIKGTELTDAVVSFSSTTQNAIAMPYTTNLSGAKSYFVDLSSSPANESAFRITTTHASLGASPVTWDLTPEAALFGAPALAAPVEGATIAASQPLDVSWGATPDADYALVELFFKQASGFAPRYTSTSSLSPDVTKVTIPATSIAAAGTYLLNVDAAQAGCQVGASMGCTYILQPATAKLTAQ